jgi:hypothetical protein
MKKDEDPAAAQSGLSDSEKIDKLIALIDGNGSKDEIFGLANGLKEDGFDQEILLDIVTERSTPGVSRKLKDIL